MNGHGNIDHTIELIRKGDLVPEENVRELCLLARDILIEEANVQVIASPVTVCGDIHGQYHDLCKLFDVGGECPATKYLFLGDFVDRGNNSVETFLLLLALKVRYPDRMLMIRGNHECRQITQVYGFYDECFRKYGDGSVWRYCCDVFDYLSLAAIIDGEILAVHGGLSPEALTLDQIRTIDRKCEIPQEGPMSDMLWSDPENISGWGVSPRGAGYLFGESVVKTFLRENGLQMIARAHQLVMEGYNYMFDQDLVTIWSAPNYCYRCGNVASIMEVMNTRHSFKIFEAADHSYYKRQKSRETISEYFL